MLAIGAATSKSRCPWLAQPFYTKIRKVTGVKLRDRLADWLSAKQRKRTSRQKRVAIQKEQTISIGETCAGFHLSSMPSSANATPDAGIGRVMSDVALVLLPSTTMIYDDDFVTDRIWAGSRLGGFSYPDVVSPP